MMDGFPGDASTAYACPRCGLVADVVAGCGGCGGPPEPEGPEVAWLLAKVGELTADVEATSRRYRELVGQLAATKARYHTLLTAVRSRGATEPAARPGPGQAGPGLTGPGAEPWPGRHAVGPAPEASPRTVQNLLFILGGLLLGSAAIVFTAVAWASFGVGGRAAILAAVTALTLLVPPIALRRGLAATAETFAAVGLLLVVLDGYAAHRVNLAGLADEMDPTTYAGIVAAGTAAVAAGYAAVTGLIGPRFVALVAVQPIVALLAATHRPGAAGWSVVFALVAALDVVVAGLGAGPRTATASAAPAPTGSGQAAESASAAAAPAGSGHSAGQGASGATLALRIVAWVLAAVTGGVAALFTVAALVLATSLPAALRAGAAATVVAAVVMLAAARSWSRTVAAVLAALAVVGWAGSAAWAVAIAWPGHTTIGTALVTFALALITAGPVLAARFAAGGTTGGGAAGSPPGWLVAGPSVGALTVAGWVGLVLAGQAVYAGGWTAARGFPAWHAGLRTSSVFGWQLPVAILLVAAGLALLVRRYPAPTADRLVVGLGVGTGVLVALAAAAAFPLPWWVPALVDGVLAAAFALLAARTSDRRLATVLGSGSAVLVAHAILAGLGRPVGTAAVLGFVVVAGGVVAALARIPVVRTGTAATAVAAVPGLAAAVGEMSAGPARVLHTPVALACAVAGLVATAGWLLVPRVTRSSVAVAACLASVAAGLGVTVAAAIVPDAPFGVVAAVSLLCAVALAGALGRSSRPAADGLLAAGTPVAVMAAVAVAPTIATVLVAPYRWLGEVWTGTIAGAGLAPGWSGAGTGPAFGAGPAAVALGILSVAAALLGWIHGAGRLFGTRPTGRPLWTSVRAALPLVSLSALAGCAALGAPWPTVPIVSLATGLGSVLLLALVAVPRPSRIPVAAVLSWCAVGAGLAGSLATRPMTLVALSAIVVVAGVCGGAGRTRPARVTGWLAAAASATTLAFASGTAVDLPTHLIAYRVLLAAGLALAVAATLAAWRHHASATRVAEARALEAAAHAAAATAFLLATGRTGHAAAVCTLWGLAIGLRTLLRGQSPDSRRYRVVAATAVELLAYWLLLAEAEVSVVEAYTVPAAAVAALAGWLTARRRPDLSSWTAYGPAMLAAFVPSLAAVLPGTGEPLRRLALGAAALVVVLGGARWRLRAPFVVGGAVLVLTALHEMALVWDLIPRWAPLAAAGLALVAVATTYERRRRDLARLRGVVGRMR
jgi:hypothetical protein